MNLLPKIFKLDKEQISTIARGDDFYYISYPIKKKSNNKVRWIDAPQMPLKALQQQLYYKYATSLPIYYYNKYIKQSVVNAVYPHLQAKVMLNLDIKDMFPSCSVKNIYKAIGTILRSVAMAKSEYFDTEDYEAAFAIATKNKHLPQGSPLSPVIANIIMKYVDTKIYKITNRYDCRYSRYVDDLTISSKDPNIDMIDILAEIEDILNQFDFSVNYNKTHITRANRCMSVTGVIANNSAPSISKKYRNNLRAAIHNIKITKDLTNLAQIQGQIAWVHTIQPKHANRLKESLNTAILI